MIIDILKQKNNLTTDENGNVYVVPLSVYEFKTAPIEEGEKCLLIPQDAYIGLLLRLYQFDETLENIVLFNSENFNAFMRKRTTGGE